MTESLFVTNPPVWPCEPIWPTLDGAPMPFIHQWHLTSGAGNHREAVETPTWLRSMHVLLFGGRRPCPEYNGFTVEYEVLAVDESQSISRHHLAQRQSTPWCESGGVDEPERLDMMSKKQAVPFLFQKPKWRRSEAEWPTAHGELMLFIGQVFTPENDITSEYLSSDMLYLFAAGSDTGGLQFAMTVMDVSEQSAEDHYKTEELMLALESTGWSREAVEGAVQQGDAYTHEFMLEHVDVTEQALVELARGGRNQQIRKAAQKRLG